jgi:hypothetical protein
MPELKKGVVELIGTVLALGLLAAVVALRQALGERLGPIVDRLFRPVHTYTRRDAEAERRVQDALVELRVATGADRAQVTQFHNGEIFSTARPSWRTSRTQEVVRPGIAYQAPRLQGVPVSHILDIIGILWGDGEEVAGVEVFCGDAGGNCRSPVYGLRLEEMRDSLGRSMLMEAGVAYLLIAPLKRAGHVVGFTGVEFCDLDERVERVADLADAVVRISQALSYLLAKE